MKPKKGFSTLDYDFSAITEAERYSELEAVHYLQTGNLKSNYETEKEYLSVLFHSNRAKHGMDISEKVIVDIRNGIPFWIVLHNEDQKHRYKWYLDKIELTYSEVKNYAKDESEELYNKFKDMNETNWSDYVDTTIKKPSFSDPKLSKLFESIGKTPSLSLTKEKALEIIKTEKLDKKFAVQFYDTEYTDGRESVLIVKAYLRGYNDLPYSNAPYYEITEVRKSVYVLEYPVEFGHGKYCPYRRIYSTVEEAYYCFIECLREQT